MHWRGAYEVMWDDIQGFIESMLEKYGLFKIVIGPYLVVSTLCGLGFLTRSTVVTFIAVALSFLSTLILLVYTSWQWRNSHAVLVERTRTLNRYIDRFVRNLESTAFSIEDWEEKVTVSRHGNTVIERWITIKVGSETLYSIWTANYKASTRPILESHRRRVAAQARDFNGRELGARYDVHDEWRSNKHRLFVHFNEPAEPGEELNLWLRCSWPAFSEDVLAGIASPVEWKLRRPAKRISSTVTFDKSSGVKGAFSIRPHRGSPRPTQEVLPDKSVAITVEYSDVKPGSLVGYTLDGQAARR